MSYDVYKIREQFPMLHDKTMQGKPLVYLDNASTTLKPQCVIDACSSYYEKYNSNSHRGDYDLMYNMDQMVLKTRETIAKFINCQTEEVIFTSGDTLSLNMIAYGYAAKHLHQGDEIIVSVEEHASNLLPWFTVAKQTGAVIKYLQLNERGELTADNLKKIISNKTKIVSLAHVGNVLGFVCDIVALAKVSHEYGAIIVVDGAQSVPHIPTDFKGWDIDFLTFSAHKMCGPTGIGCLVGKYHLLEETDPLITGGGMNVTFKEDGTIEYLNPPYKFEAGTQNLSGILGFKAAVDFLSSLGMANIKNHEEELKKYTIERIKDIKDVEVYNQDSPTGIVTFNLKGIFAQDEATLFNHKGIAIRSGLHCAKLFPTFLKTPATCRMSIYLYTTKEEIDAFVEALKDGGNILDAYFSE